MEVAKKVRPIQLDGKVIFVDENDSFVSNELYDYAMSCDDCWVVIKSGARGAVNKYGKKIIPCEYEIISSIGKDSSFIKVYVGGKWGIYSKDGQMILPCQYDELKEVKSGMFYFTKNNRAGVVDAARHEYYQDTQEYNLAMSYETRIQEQKLLVRRAIELAHTDEEVMGALVNGKKEVNRLRAERADAISGKTNFDSEHDLTRLKERAKISIDSF